MLKILKQLNLKKKTTISLMGIIILKNKNKLNTFWYDRENTLKSL